VSRRCACQCDSSASGVMNEAGAGDTWTSLISSG
jgi:hypothetical protein